MHSEPGARSEAHSRGIPGSETLPSAPEENLILRAMRHAAERHGLHLPPVHLAVQNQIPIAGGLGSSAAAIVAGIALGFAVCKKKLTEENALRLAAEMEQHTDNVGAALLGGLVVSFVGARWQRRRVAQKLAETNTSSRRHAKNDAANSRFARRVCHRRSNTPPPCTISSAPHYFSRLWTLDVMIFSGKRCKIACINPIARR